MTSRTEFWTLSFSDWPSNAAVSSLSDVLEDGEPPRRYFLSPTALSGVLARDRRRPCRFVLRRGARVLSTTEKHTLLNPPVCGT